MESNTKYIWLGLRLAIVIATIRQIHQTECFKTSIMRIVMLHFWRVRDLLSYNLKPSPTILIISNDY